MATANAKFELTIGALDKFSAPFEKFGAAVDKSASRVTRFGRECGVALRRVSAGLGVPKFQGAFKSWGNGMANVGAQARVFARRIGMIAALGGAAAAGIYASVRAFTDAGDAAVKTAQKAGVTSAAWQEMAYAADLSGVSAEKLQAAYVKLQKNMVSAASGGKAQAAAFKTLGIELKNSEGLLKDNDTVMMEMAEALSKMPDGAKKTALAMEIFGKSGAELLPLLNNGEAGLKDLRREAQELGLVFGGDVSKASEEFNDNVSRLQYRVKGLIYSLGESFLPVAKDVVAMLSSLIDENRELIKTKMAEFADKIIKAMPKIKEGIEKAAGKIKDMAKWGGKAVSMLGGFGNVAKIAAGVLSGPLVASVTGLIGPVFKLAGAFLSTPLGVFAAIAGGAVLLANKLGALDPFIKGVKSAFSDFGEVVGPAFQNLLTKVGELLGAIFGKTEDVNQAFDPKAVEAFGKALGDYTEGALSVFIDSLAEIIGWFKAIGEFMGSAAGRLVFGDAGKLEKTNEQIEALNAQAAKANAAGNKDAAKEYLRQAEQLRMYKTDWAGQRDEMGRPIASAALSTLPGQNPAGLPTKTNGPPAGRFGPAALKTGGAPVVVQESKHTEETINKLDINVNAPPGTGISQTGPNTGNVRVTNSPHYLGQQGNY